MWDLIVSVPDHCLSFYFEFNMVVCFGIHLAPYAVLSTRIYLQHTARPV